ncbi:MAG: dihydropteroate synthase [Planctomycetota bacterium]
MTATHEHLTPPTWRVRADLNLTLDRPRLMAILNVTPDSFADGGQLTSPSLAADAAQRAADEGADVLDIGAESTRPGARRIDASEQIRRAAPAIEAIRAAGVSLPISIDTTRTEVARAALDAGADAVNDVSGGTEDAGLLPLIAERGAGVILMHRAAAPPEDQYSDRFNTEPDFGLAGVVAYVRTALGGYLDRARAAGIDADAIVLDPGLGFGKSVQQNLDLIRGTPDLLTLGRPVLSALSRKSFVGRVSLDRDSAPSERLAGTLACSVRHWGLGARLFRVHDVAPHREALAAAAAFEGAQQA